MGQPIELFEVAVFRGWATLEQRACQYYVFAYCRNRFYCMEFQGLAIASATRPSDWLRCFGERACCALYEHTGSRYHDLGPRRPDE